MPSNGLLQATANFLITVEKHAENDNEWDLPALARTKHAIPLISPDARGEKFLLDVSRGSIALSKITYQMRCRKSIPLVRIDFDGPDHVNPDDEVIPTPHIHIYREKFDMKWAYAIPNEIIEDASSPAIVLEQFLAYCNITHSPKIQLGLF